MRIGARLRLASTSRANAGQRGLQERVLMEEVLVRIAGQPELGKHRQRRVRVVRRAARARSSGRRCAPGSRVGRTGCRRPRGRSRGGKSTRTADDSWFSRWTERHAADACARILERPRGSRWRSGCSRATTGRSASAGPCTTAFRCEIESRSSGGRGSGVTARSGSFGSATRNPLPPVAMACPVGAIHLEILAVERPVPRGLDDALRLGILDEDRRLVIDARVDVGLHAAGSRR